MRQIETERKYLIEMPKAEVLCAFPDFEESGITQIYLGRETGRTHRVRKREFKGKTVYIENMKTRLSPMSVIEEEREITQEEFTALLEKIEEGSSPVLKKRIAFTFGCNLLEIDLYPRWNKIAILEIELAGEDILPEIPHEIRIIKEVTGDKRYSNHALSHFFPSEEEILGSL